jgi:O-antigen polymerase
MNPRIPATDFMRMNKFLSCTFQAGLILLILQLPFSFLSVPFLVRISQSVQSAWLVIGVLGIMMLIMLMQPIHRLGITFIDVAIILYIGFLLILQFARTATPVDPLFLAESGVTILAFLFFRLTPKKGLFLLLGMVALSSLIQAVLGILQFVNAHPFYSESTGITGSFFNPGPFAGYLLLSIPAALAVYLYPGQTGKLPESSWLIPKIKSIALTIYLTIVCIAIVLSKSRAAWLGLFISLLFFVATIYKTKAKLVWTNFRGIVKLLTLFISMGSVLFLAWMLYDWKPDSAQGRMLIWRNSVNMIAGHPLSGVGLNQFQAHYMNQQADYFKINPTSDAIRLADNTIYPFNTFLKLITEQGLLAVIPVCLILFAVFYSKSRQPARMNPQLAAIRAGLIGLIVFSLFSYPEAILPIRVHACLFVAILAGYQAPVLREVTAPHFVNANPWLRKGLILVLGVSLLVFLAGKLSETTRGTHQWSIALKKFNRDHPDEALLLMERAFPALGGNGIFCSIYGGMLEQATRPHEAIEVLNRAEILMPTTNVLISQAECLLQLQDYPQAEQKLRRAQLMIPSRIKPTYLLVKMYLSQNDLPRAQTEYQSYMKYRSKVTVATYSLEYELIQALDEYKYQHSDLIP